VRGFAIFANTHFGEAAANSATSKRASEGLYEPRDSARAFFATIASTTLWETKLADGFSHL
jgi:hypothetical protein